MAKTTKYAGVLRELSAAEELNLDERGIPKKLGRQYRKVSISAYDKETHTVTMAVSSSTPVERYFGVEVLSHDKGALNADRLKSGIALLFNHDYDQHLGRSQSYELGDPLHVTCRFGSNPLALEKEGDVETGILVDVSIGYIVDEWDIVENAKTGVRTYTATKWTLLEVSLVTVPADPTVGVGRAASLDETPVKYNLRKVEEDASEDESEDEEEDDDADDGDRSASLETSTTIPAEQRTEPMATANAGVDLAAQNQERVTGLRALHTQFPKEFNQRSLDAAIALDLPLERAKAAIADAIITGAQRSDVPTVADSVFDSMSERELGKYSLRNIYAAAVNRAVPGTFTDKESEAGFEREVGETLRKEAEKRGISGLGAGIAIPSATSRAMARVTATRNLAAGGNAGSATNFTTVEADVIELLRARTAVLALGAQMMPGLQGTIQMPRQTGAATSSWVPETSAVSESDPTLDFITVSPHPLMINNAYYRNLLAQSRLAVDSFLARDRERVLALSLDTATIAGSGASGVPLGLLNQTGLPAVLSGTTRASNGTVTAGTGGVPMTFVDYNNMEAAISTANADIGTMGWLTTPKIRAAGRSTPQIPGTASGFVWPNSKVGANGIQEGPLGYNALCTSNSVLTGFTANSVNNLHAVILGVWDQIIIGDWGLSEVLVDPYTGAKSQLIQITENAFYDTNVRHLAAFAACTSALPS